MPTVAITALDATAAANLSSISATTVTAAVANDVTFTGNLGTAHVTVAATKTLTAAASVVTGKTIDGAGTVAITALDATAAANLSAITATTVTAAVSNDVTFTGNLGTAHVTVAATKTLTATAATVAGKTIDGAGTVAITALDATAAADLSTITATTVTAAVADNVTFTGNLGTAVVTVADTKTLTAAAGLLIGKTINHDGSESGQALVATLAAAAAASDLSTVTSNITSKTADFTETQTFTGNLGNFTGKVEDNVTVTAAVGKLTGKTINHDGSESGQKLIALVASTANASDLTTINSDLSAGNKIAVFTQTQTFSGNLGSFISVVSDNQTLTLDAALASGKTISSSSVGLTNGAVIITGTASGTVNLTGLTNHTTFSSGALSIAEAGVVMVKASAFSGTTLTVTGTNGGVDEALVVIDTATNADSTIDISNISATDAFVSAVGLTGADTITLKTGTANRVGYATSSDGGATGDIINNFEVANHKLGFTVTDFGGSGVNLSTVAGNKDTAADGISSGVKADVSSLGANSNGVIRVSDNAAANWSDVATVAASAITGTNNGIKAILLIDNGTDTRAYYWNDGATTSDSIVETTELTLLGTLVNVADATGVNAIAV